MHRILNWINYINTDKSVSHIRKMCKLTNWFRFLSNTLSATHSNQKIFILKTSFFIRKIKCIVPFPQQPQGSRPKHCPKMTRSTSLGNPSKMTLISTYLNSKNSAIILVEIALWSSQLTRVAMTGLNVAVTEYFYGAKTPGTRLRMFHCMLLYSEPWLE